MDTSVSAAPEGLLLSGRYRVGARVARGGMATVYEALDERLQRRVALKVMHPDLAEDAGFVARFIGEARSAAQLSHPDVVSVFDQGEDDDWVWLAMEYVRGRTLRAVLHERRRLDPALALEVLAHVVSALEEAHRHGIAHRDVKPENVLVAVDGRVKVADFGLARAVSGGSSTTTRGVLLGTVAYLSPEQALGEPATLRSDVYSTGVVAYELLTGHPPHEGLTDYLVVRKHIEEDVPPPSAAVPGIPPPVDALVLRATARDPDERYADAGRLLVDLRRVRAALGGAVAEDARAPGSRERSTRPIVDLHRTPEPEPVRTPGGTPLGTPPSTTDGDGADPPVLPRRRRARGLVAFLLVLLLAVGGAGAAYWYGWARWVPTPALLGRTAAQADAAARAAGFTTRVAAEQPYSETAPAGQVVATDPAPGATVLPGSTLTLVLSRGPERFDVPAVVGRALADAAAALTARSLVVGTTQQRYDERVPAGRVLAQSTQPGSDVRRGSRVDLVVSRGKQPIPVPDLRGRSEQDARSTLRELGLVPALSREHSTSVAAGRILQQDPRSGTLVRGEEVALVVSRGPRLVTVPSVVGSGASSAQARVARAGLRASVVRVLSDGPGQVLKQSPVGGTRQRPGNEVVLYVY